MKTFAILVTLVTVWGVRAHHIPHESKDKIFGYHKDCLAKSGTKERLVENARLGEVSDDPHFKEYLYCLSQKFGFQNEAGEFQKDVIKEKLLEYHVASEKVEEILEKCAVQKDSPVESASEYYKCYYKNTPNHDFLFYVATFDEEIYKKVKQYKQDCVVQTGTDQSLVEKADKGDFSEDAAFKQYLLCFSKKFGLQNDDGKIQEDLAKEKLTNIYKADDIVEDLYKKCLKEQKSSEDTAYYTLKCLHEHSYINVLNVPTINEKDKRKLIQSHESCKSESKITSEMVDQAKNGKFPENDIFKAHLLCIYKDIGIMNDAGSLDKKVIAEDMKPYYDSQTIEKVVEKCDVQSDSPPNTAYKALKCFFENIPNSFNVFTAF